MSTAPPTYVLTALNDLAERTEYEAWLLEAVYDVVNQPLTVSDEDALIYPPDGGPPAHIVYGRAATNLGDWRPGFLEVGAPLVFMTAFKLLDMLLEWVLVQNGKTSTFRFVQKIGELRGPVVFPPLIETRSWLRDRLIALYEQLEPLRGTLIHDRHFQAAGGTLEVSSSRRGTIGPVVRKSPADLRNLALVLVSVLRYVEGTWTMDLFGEKRLRHALDELGHLHRSPSLGQLVPGFLTVRVLVPDEDPIEIDLGRIRGDIAAKRSRQDVLFAVRIIVVARDGSGATAHLVDSDQLQSAESLFRKTRAELAGYIVPLPGEIDPATAAREMKQGGSGPPSEAHPYQSRAKIRPLRFATECAAKLRS